MISKFFIDRPVFASVLSIVIVLAGLVAMRVLPISQYPQIVPPEVVVSATYPGATAETIADVGRRPARAADQRRRAHDLHAVDLDRLGHDEPHRHLRDRHQPRPERHQRQQPCAARPAVAAGRGQPPGPGRAEALDLDPAGPDHVVAGRPLRHDLHQQLRPGERARRVASPAGRRRRRPVRRLGLFHAHLAPARQARAIQPHARRRRRRGPRAEPAVRRRPLRRGADEPAAGLHLLGDDAATPGRPYPVRGHHHPLGGEWRRAPAEGRGARRARCAALRLLRHLQRLAGGAHRGVPAARRQRHPGGSRGEGGHGDHLQALPRRPALRHPVRHHALRRGLDRGGRHHLRRGDRPSSCWWCSCSCRAYGQ